MVLLAEKAVVIHCSDSKIFTFSNPHIATHLNGLRTPSKCSQGVCYNENWLYMLKIMKHAEETRIQTKLGKNTEIELKTCSYFQNTWVWLAKLFANRSVTYILKVQTHWTWLDNTTRFFDFHWPITLILVYIFQIFRSAITFWVIWSTYHSKFVLIGCFIKLTFKN
jgi:hypothetical protein